MCQVNCCREFSIIFYFVFIQNVYSNVKAWSIPMSIHRYLNCRNAYLVQFSCCFQYQYYQYDTSAVRLTALEIITNPEYLSTIDVGIFLMHSDFFGFGDIFSFFLVMKFCSRLISWV